MIFSDSHHKAVHLSKNSTWLLWNTAFNVYDAGFFPWMSNYLCGNRTHK